MISTVPFSIFTGTTLRRVRREVAKPVFNKPEPYIQLLACWGDFLRSNDRDLGVGGYEIGQR